MKRKTIAVSELISLTNSVLRNSTCSPEYRQGQMNLLEAVLHLSGNYKGFEYLGVIDVPKGEKPGIHPFIDGPHGYKNRFINTDNTRVAYFQQFKGA